MIVYAILDDAPPPKKKTEPSRCTVSAYGYGFPVDLINKDDVHSANVAIALPYLGRAR